MLRHIIQRNVKLTFAHTSLSWMTAILSPGTFQASILSVTSVSKAAVNWQSLTYLSLLSMLWLLRRFLRISETNWFNKVWRKSEEKFDRLENFHFMLMPEVTHHTEWVNLAWVKCFDVNPCRKCPSTQGCLADCSKFYGHRGINGRSVEDSD